MREQQLKLMVGHGERKPLLRGAVSCAMEVGFNK